ncbi:MAG: AAA family ATPase [Gammaproteobacteria bacterium]|nr:MAG: AAA family ATPase [Gammaproteobacteria bacterium]
MYLEFFGISDKPFQITPDTRFLYLTPRHRDGLAHLLYGADEAGGFILLTGEVGTGKTMLCRSVLEQMPDHVNVALILNPRQSSKELIASICDELNIPYRRSTTSLKYLVDRLNLYLLKQHAQGKRTVLVVDEAQNLRAEVLEQIRLLTNLEVATQKLLQIILIGQPELQAILARPELRQLTQRITARFHLTPLSKEETAAYIRHRLQIVGFKGELFSKGAVQIVHQLSDGVPRLVNNICERSMMGAYGENVHRIDKNLVRKAAGEVLQPTERFQPMQWVAGGAIAAGTAALLLSIWGLLPSASQESYANAGPATTNVETLASQATIEDKSVTQKNEEVGAPAINISSTNNTETVASQQRPLAEELSSVKQGNKGFLNLINDSSLRTGNNKAFTTLFSYWGLTYPELNGETACERATAAELRCIFGKAGWDEIRRHNRPAVLEIINSAGERKQIVVLALRGNQVSLNIGGKVVTTATKSVDPFWYGNYLLLWRSPPAGSNVLKEGVIGKDVGWLRDQLDRIEGKAVSTGIKKKLSFDPTLKWRVMEFQRIRGLNVDGVAGRETMMEINSAVNDRSTPLLWRQSS